MAGFKKSLTRGGDWMAPEFGRFFNRTGATMVRGQLAMVDLLGTQGESTSFQPGGTGSGTSVWGNAGPITQLGHDKGYPIVLLLDDSLADNAEGFFCLRHPAIEMALVDADVSTTDVLRGNPLTVLVTQASSAGGALTTGGAAAQMFISGTTKRVIGISHEDAAADSTDTDRLINASNHLRWVCFFGGYPGAGYTLA